MDARYLPGENSHPEGTVQESRGVPHIFQTSEQMHASRIIKRKWLTWTAMCCKSLVMMAAHQALIEKKNSTTNKSLPSSLLVSTSTFF